MARYVSDSVYIASIYPGELASISRNVGPRPEINSPRRTTFKLKPVKRGETPFVMEVSDSWENIHNPMRSHKRSEQWESKIVDCNEIRADIVKEWAGNIFDCPAGASMGVMAISGVGTSSEPCAACKTGLPHSQAELLKFHGPTEVEMTQLLDMQTRFAEWSFQRGEEAVRDKKTAEIRGIWRTMAIWLGRKTTNNWATPALAAHDVNCVWCQTLISPNARVCATCGREQEEDDAESTDASEPIKRRPGRPRKETFA